MFLLHDIFNVGRKGTFQMDSNKRIPLYIILSYVFLRAMYFKLAEGRFMAKLDLKTAIYCDLWDPIWFFNLVVFK